MLGLIDDQQDLELLGERGGGNRLLHEPGGRLFDGVGDGAEGAEEARGTTGGGGLGLRRLLGLLARTPFLSGGGSGGSLGRGRGRGLGRGQC